MNNERLSIKDYSLTSAGYRLVFAYLTARKQKEPFLRSKKAQKKQLNKMIGDNLEVMKQIKLFPPIISQPGLMRCASITLGKFSKRSNKRLN